MEAQQRYWGKGSEGKRGEGRGEKGIEKVSYSKDRILDLLKDRQEVRGDAKG